MNFVSNNFIPRGASCRSQRDVVSCVSNSFIQLKKLRNNSIVIAIVVDES